MIPGSAVTHSHAGFEQYCKVTSALSAYRGNLKLPSASPGASQKGTDSTTGVSGALDGTYTIGMASRELKDSEVEGGAKATVLAKDGIAVIVSNDNPTDNLTVDQIKGIYTGELTTWADVQ